MLRLSILTSMLAAASVGSITDRPAAFIAGWPDVVERAPEKAPSPLPAAKSFAPAGPPASTVVTQSADGLFYVTAKVNGQKVRFVIDTGASVVVLNASDAARTGVGASSHDVSVETARGSASMQRTRISNMAVAGQSMASVDALIVKDDLKVSLLGQSALSQLGSVAFKGPRLELN